MGERKRSTARPGVVLEAMHAFRARLSDELSFVKGDLFEVVDWRPDGWSLVSRMDDGRRGRIPSNVKIFFEAIAWVNSERAHQFHIVRLSAGDERHKKEAKGERVEYDRKSHKHNPRYCRGRKTGAIP